jgi:methylmalonyl-CoA mutase C-terminal domain/subunit
MSTQNEATEKKACDSGATGSETATPQSTRPIRILIAKAGLDGHDRGAKVIARALRDAGMEVIYTGLHQTTDNIVRAAIQEDVDYIGLSILSGAHMTLFPELLEKLAQQNAADIGVFGGGIIPKDDILALKQLGVREIFVPGTSTQDVVAWIRANVGGAAR